MKRTPVPTGIIALPFLLIFLIVGLTVGWLVRRHLSKRIPPIISEKATILARRRRHLIYADAYGTIDQQPWTREREYFLTSAVLPSLHWWQRCCNVKPTLERLINEAADRADLCFVPTPRDPLSYEQYCAEILREAGWRTDLTRRSGDQGADIIAQRSERRVVIQCKRYSKSVGNKAVQEVSAARLHYRCDIAAVVSNQSFTRSARALAATNAVHLINHEDLESWVAGGVTELG